jgi:hypothetical protein
MEPSGVVVVVTADAQSTAAPALAAPEAKLHANSSAKVSRQSARRTIARLAAGHTAKATA